MLAAGGHTACILLLAIVSSRDVGLSLRVRFNIEFPTRSASGQGSRPAGPERWMEYN